MIGLPTSTTSRTCVAVDAGRRRRARRRARGAPSRTAPVSASAPPGFIITYDTRLIRSSPNRICGFMMPGRRERPRRSRGRRGARRSWSSRRRPRCRTRASVKPGKTATIVGAPPVAGRRSATVAARASPAIAACSVGEHRGVDAVDDHVVLLAQRGRAAGRPRSCRRRGGQLDVGQRARADRRRDRRGPRPCGRPAGAPGSSPARRSPRRRRSVAVHAEPRVRRERAGEARVALGRRRSASSASASASIAHFANVPVVGRTWQWPQIARPPHTESRSTPSAARRVEHGRAGLDRGPRARPGGTRPGTVASRLATAAVAGRARRSRSFGYSASKRGRGRVGRGLERVGAWSRRCAARSCGATRPT